MMSFMDFIKAYDFIDRDTLMNVLKEFGIDNKSTTLIQQTMTNVKFLELSEPFEIQRGDGFPQSFSTRKPGVA